MTKHTLTLPLGIAIATLPILLALASGVAYAHPGHAHEPQASALATGLLHPLTGFDHLLAMLAVGLWAALTHDKLSQAIWTPLGFAFLLLVGALAGIAGVTLPAVEPIIGASLLVLGLLLATPLALPRLASAVLVSFFAVFHGLAHGAELPPDIGAAGFVAGFLLSTLALHALGLATGFAIKGHGTWIPRLAGAGMAAYSMALLVTA